MEDHLTEQQERASVNNINQILKYKLDLTKVMEVIKMKRILTYGTFDLLHYGHIEILRRAKELGDYLVVAVSTDEFNRIKNKKAYHNYETRKK